MNDGFAQRKHRYYAVATYLSGVRNSSDPTRPRVRFVRPSALVLKNCKESELYVFTKTDHSNKFVNNTTLTEGSRLHLKSNNEWGSLWYGLV